MWTMKQKVTVTAALNIFSVQARPWRNTSRAREV